VYRFKVDSLIFGNTSKSSADQEWNAWHKLPRPIKEEID